MWKRSQVSAGRIDACDAVVLLFRHLKVEPVIHLVHTNILETEWNVSRHRIQYVQLVRTAEFLS